MNFKYIVTGVWIFIELFLYKKAKVEINKLR